MYFKLGDNVHLLVLILIKSLLLIMLAFSPPLFFFETEKKIVFTLLSLGKLFDVCLLLPPLSLCSDQTNT